MDTDMDLSGSMGQDITVVSGGSPCLSHQAVPHRPRISSHTSSQCANLSAALSLLPLHHTLVR